MTDNQDIHDRLVKVERESAENRHGLINSKNIWDIQFKQLGSSIDDLRNILKWAGGLIVTLMLSFMSWAALQQYNANESQKRDLQQQITLLKQQDDAAVERARILQEIQKSNPGATITAIPPGSR